MANIARCQRVDLGSNPGTRSLILQSRGNPSQRWIPGLISCLVSLMVKRLICNHLTSVRFCHWAHFPLGSWTARRLSAKEFLDSSTLSRAFILYRFGSSEWEPDQGVFPLPVSVLGELIWARRVRLHTTMTLSICSTQASGRKYLAPCRTPLRKGQNSRQNPSHTNNFSRYGTPLHNAHQSYV